MNIFSFFCFSSLFYTFHSIFYAFIHYSYLLIKKQFLSSWYRAKQSFSYFFFGSDNMITPAMIPTNARIRARIPFFPGSFQFLSARSTIIITGAVYCRTVAIPALESSTAR